MCGWIMKIFILDRVSSFDKGPSSNTLHGSLIHKFELSRNLSKLGHKVHVMDNTGSEHGEIVFHQLRDKKEGKWGALIFRMDYLFKILSLSRKHNFDIIYTRNGTTGLAGLLIGKIYGSKFVFELNGLFSEDWRFEKELNGKLGFNRTLKFAIMNRIEMFVAKRADAIISVTDGIKNILIEKGINRNKIFTVSNGVNTDLFKPIDNDAVLYEARDRLGVGKDDHIICFVGVIEAWHGIEYLIKSTSLVLKTYPNSKFLIVGEGKIRKDLMNLAENLGVIDKFIFTGSVPHHTVPLYICLSDVCVAPFTSARNEVIGLSPLKIYEYLACEKPVVSSNIVGVGDLLEESKSGIAVASGDSVELASAITGLLKNEQLREKMGKNARKLVVNNYCWENTAMKTIEVFGGLLD